MMFCSPHPLESLGFGGEAGSRLSFQEKCYNYSVELVWRWNQHCSCWELSARNTSSLLLALLPPALGPLLCLELDQGQLKGFIPLTEAGSLLCSLSHFQKKNPMQICTMIELGHSPASELQKKLQVWAVTIMRRQDRYHGNFPEYRKDCSKYDQCCLLAMSTEGSY